MSANYPIELSFKISTLANDFVAKDASGTTIAYVRQKMFKLIDEIVVFADESKSKELYRIAANKWLDFSATYNFTTSDGKEIGKVARKGWRSVWKARYEVFAPSGEPSLLIQEENPWTKVLDALLNEVPILNLFSGYMFNPGYTVSRTDGTQVVLLKKQPSFFGRKFRIIKHADFLDGEEERTLLALMMMILLERRRG
jgi:hypothetical protein